MSLLDILQEQTSRGPKATSATAASGVGLKAILITIAGLAGVTAASAGISSLRRRQEKLKDGS